MHAKPKHPAAPSLRFDPPFAVLCLVTLLVAVSALVRFAGTHWDATAGLHPDERHMLFVSTRLMRALQALPETGLGVAELWFSESSSPLNPRAGGESYVYGEAPLLVTTLVGWFTNLTGWDELMILGRQIAALIDSLTVLAIFMTCHPLWGWRTAFASAALYAAAPTALQLANFYTVDIWLAAAVAWSLLFLMVLDRSEKRGAIAGSATAAGFFLGAAVACKVSGLALLLPAGIVVLRLAMRRSIADAALACIFGFLTAFAVFRLANPFAFAGPGPLGLLLAEAWLRDMRTVIGFSELLDFPPGWQWMAGYGPLRFARDAALFGFGPVMTLVAGLAVLRWRKAPKVLLIPASLAGVYLLQGLVTEIAVLRYVAPAIPATAVIAGAALSAMGSLPLIVSIAASLWWGAATVRLHDGYHPRILASVWLWTQPRGTVLLNETSWDEGLPAAIRFSERPEKRYPDADGHFELLTLDIVAPDSVEKADKMADLIDRADLVILSSGRQREVMPRLPERFPLTAAYYRMLESGEACLELAWSRDRGYPLPGIRLDDSWAQEPWRVYDHPIVRIYRKAPCFDAMELRRRLRAALAQAGSAPLQP
ncbi:glycosyltransferase family 39 protein [Aestuariivirga sp.]|uniref:glycosyltransferase family 39 protein n=1 Tax=Aestuariivirga sp. TaxID=2650926 RepID=UPI00391936AF